MVRNLIRGARLAPPTQRPPSDACTYIAVHSCDGVRPGFGAPTARLSRSRMKLTGATSAGSSSRLTPRNYLAVQ
jgi:hypothetical protein